MSSSSQAPPRVARRSGTSPSLGTSDDLVVREYRPGDEAAILRGFNRAFARVDPSFEPRSLEVWEWLYRRNPAGLRIWFALTPEGEVVNQQAGLPVRVRQDGRVVLWTQIVDSFTDPDLARGLKKPGLFIRAATPFWQHYGGAAPHQDAFHYGTPVRSAFRIGKRFLGYQACRQQNKLRVPVDGLACSPTLGGVGVSLEEVARFPLTVDPFFDAASADRGAIVVRHAEHLNWRYADRPERDYRIVLARDVADDSLIGYAVYRPGDFDGEEVGLLCDWMVARDEPRAQEALLDWLVDRARADGVEHVDALFAETSPEWIAFQRAGFRVRPTRYFLVARSYRPAWDLRWLHDHWHYTLGDFDLC